MAANYISRVFAFVASIALLCAVGTPFAQASVDETAVEKILYVDINHPEAKDENEGTDAEKPLRTIQAAVDKAEGTPTKILVADGAYRHYVDIESDENLLIIEAENDGAARITGADQVREIREVTDGLYAFHWPHDWGMGNTVFKGYKPEYWLARRKEMVFVDGQRLTMRMTVETNGDVLNPVNPADLETGEFTVDETRDSIFFTMPDGADLSSETAVEVTVRGTAERGYGNNSGILMDIIEHPNLVLRGLVFTQSGNHIKSDPAVRIRSNSSGGNDRRHLSEHILIENCQFIENKSGGFKMQNSRNVTIRNCRFDNNGINGISTNCLEDVLIDSCSFSGNNWAGGKWMAGHHGAGIKMLSGQDKDGWFPQKTDKVLLRKCVMRGNHCPGYWQDYGGNNITLEQCLIEDNKSRGVDNEMTFGNFTLKNCVIRNNGICNVQVYGASNMTIDGCVIYGATTGGNTTESKYVANFRFIADDRTNDDHHADIRFHTIINSVINATNPNTSNYRLYKYGSNELETFGKLPYLNTLTSDYNRWYRRDQESFPWPLVFMGTRTFPNEGWKEAWPDMTWDEYRALEPESGRKLDEHSEWVDVDCDRVADSVLGIESSTPAVCLTKRSVNSWNDVRIVGNVLDWSRHDSPVLSVRVVDAGGRTIHRYARMSSGGKRVKLPTDRSRMLWVHIETAHGKLTRTLLPSW